LKEETPQSLVNTGAAGILLLVKQHSVLFGFHAHGDFFHIEASLLVRLCRKKREM
jgi:hypothetical protein